MILSSALWRESLRDYISTACKHQLPGLGCMLFGFVLLPFELLAKPYYFKGIFDQAGTWQHLHGLSFLSILALFYPYLLCLLLFEVGYRLYDVVSVRVLPELKATIRLHALRHLLAHDEAFFAQHAVGGLCNRLQQLPEQIVHVLTACMTVYLPSILGMVLSILCLSYFSFALAALVLCWFSVYGFLVYWGLRVGMKPAQHHAKVHQSLCGELFDLMLNLRTVDLFSQHGFECDRFKRRQASDTAAYRACIRQQVAMRSLFSLCSSLFVCLGSALALWQGCLGVLHAGDVAFALLLLQHLVQQAWQMSHNAVYTAETIAYIQETLCLFGPQPSPLSGVKKHAVLASASPIVLHSLCFSYPKGRRILQDVCAELRPGKRIFFSGGSGSGKSTLLRLLAGLYPLQDGSLRWGGQSYRSGEKLGVEAGVVLLPQEPALFDRSVYENVTYGLSVSPESVDQALRQAEAMDFVTALPKGIHTRLGRQGGLLSRGQRQRLLLARFFLQSASLYLFDEALASLDEDLQAILLPRIFAHAKGSITVMVSHQADHWAWADVIYQVNAGCLLPIE